MAAAVQTAPQPVSTTASTLASALPTRHNVRTLLNYYKDPEDGSEPAPSYVGQPQTYDRPVEPAEVTVTDISGREKEFTLDTHGFQVYGHASREKDFVDEEKIRREYYPETEQLLKDA